MIGVPGTAHRLFGALREEGISVILISQGSSEHSICCAIPQAQAGARQERARCRVRARAGGGTDPERGCHSRAGDPGRRRRRHGGHAGSRRQGIRRTGQRAHQCARHRAGRLGAQYLGGRRRTQATRALRATHASFYLSPHTLSIGVIGPGTVGSVLLDQLAGQRERLAREFKIDLRVRGILRSQQMRLADSGVALQTWREQLRTSMRSRLIWPASSSTCAWTICRTRC